jgi:hypothetical protein
MKAMDYGTGTLAGSKIRGLPQAITDEYSED